MQLTIRAQKLHEKFAFHNFFFLKFYKNDYKFSYFTSSAICVIDITSKTMKLFFPPKICISIIIFPQILQKCLYFTSITICVIKIHIKTNFVAKFLSIHGEKYPTKNFFLYYVLLFMALKDKKNKFWRKPSNIKKIFHQIFLCTVEKLSPKFGRIFRIFEKICQYLVKFCKSLKKSSQIRQVWQIIFVHCMCILCLKNKFHSIEFEISQYSPKFIEICVFKIFFLWILAYFIF